jgi:mannose/fructose-specific phosphotransferase system component IIA
MIRGIIVGHGSFAASMLKTVEEIVGKQQHIDIVSNQGLSGTMLIEKIRKSIGPDQGHETIVFVDLPGGSCTISCYSLLKNMNDLNVICGVNLPMLLEFFMLREKYSAQELVPILIRKGKENIFKLEQKK